MTFQLDDRLAKDTVEITNLDLCRVTLMQDQRFPWLILVPRRAGLVELTDLNPSDQHALIDEIARASSALRLVFHDIYKMNIATLGNVVPQLHVHVVGRRTTDDAWPGPVWGVGVTEPYAGDALKQIVNRLHAALA
ncbi:MAG: HIT domain-containing protein [Alphaproteobacteria bacterium]|nr:HIT domain-containing protein [Alphaproteobacteria bacterium]